MTTQRKPDITKVCAHCGETFTRPDWKVYRDAIYCGPACYRAARLALPPEQRAALMAEATAKIRGSKRTHDDLCKRAQTKQCTSILSGDEAEIYRRLWDYALTPIPFYAIDKFNVDFAFPDEKLAVEYQGGNWHNTPKKQAQDEAKAAFLKANGWTLLVFPRIAKARTNNSGNRRIEVDDIVHQIREHLYLLAYQNA